MFIPIPKIWEWAELFPFPKSKKSFLLNPGTSEQQRDEGPHRPLGGQEGGVAVKFTFTFLLCLIVKLYIQGQRPMPDTDYDDEDDYKYKAAALALGQQWLIMV